MTSGVFVLWFLLQALAWTTQRLTPTATHPHNNSRTSTDALVPAILVLMNIGMAYMSLAMQLGPT